MKYIIRLLLCLIVSFFTFSVISVFLLRFVPVGFTPLKFTLLSENRMEKRPFESRWVPIGDISPEMVRAVVATEDNNFLKHSGFDFEAIRKAIEENREGRRLLGASTISQQTVKNVFCLPGRTWLRKGFETWFTVWIEWLWSKERIMEVYLNVIETHPNIYGVEATARHFYDKPAADLNRYEAAMIATVLPGPARMNIGKPSAYMTRRAARVRSLMAKIGPVDLKKPSGKEEETRKK